ncbi:MAG: L,D-transpeptidase [Synergistes jonesii]|uniref:L,D-transpeptidase n=1 Tax=Synergistes jonesii TaxID=2754 RepID=UPI002A751339|nr:L,D-transpeptidase [Synergistes jonesii]MDY2985468.1 L,D-transpeptidase [Synergistes jonesii]
MKKIFVLSFLALLLCAAPSFAVWSPQDGEYWIRINKEKLKLTLYRGGETVKSWPVSIGRGLGKVKTSRMDLITPAGTFTIYRVIQDASKLIYDPAWFNEEGEPSEGVYGSKLISFYNKWQIAIHGTNNPGSVGRRATHGCIRLKNRDINELVTYVKPKMKLVIVEGDGIPFSKETI